MNCICRYCLVDFGLAQFLDDSKDECEKASSALPSTPRPCKRKLIDKEDNPDRKKMKLRSPTTAKDILFTKASTTTTPISKNLAANCKGD